MNKKTTQPSIPSGWDREACALWAANQRVEAVNQVLASIQKAPWTQPDLTLQCAYYMYLLNDFGSAAGLLEQQLKATPDHFEVVLNLAVSYSSLARWAACEKLYRHAATLKPDSFAVFDGLSNCLHRLQRDSDAGEAGTRALELKDRRCDTESHKHWALPQSSPQAFASRPGKRKVIAYSLWGAQPTYLRGALRNLLLAPDLYPGWTLRFNVDQSVPQAFICLIKRLGGEVVVHAPNHTLRQKLCWRFQVANDPGVGYFLVRDADSVISMREVQAVQAWLASDRWFHVMRDWWTHTDLMLAGMWGGVAGVLPHFVDMSANYRSPAAETPNVDQWFLRDQVWPLVRQSCMAHDRCFHFSDSLPFPGPEPFVDRHLGQDEYAAHRLAQEQFLSPWIEAYPCLGPLQTDIIPTEFIKERT